LDNVAINRLTILGNFLVYAEAFHYIYVLQTKVFTRNEKAIKHIWWGNLLPITGVISS
jgi:hypothetical protein